MDRQSAISLIVFLQKAAQVVPTTGNEWGAMQGAIRLIEQVANGQITVESKSTQIHEVKPSENQTG